VSLSYTGQQHPEARRNELFLETSITIRDPWTKEVLENNRYYLNDQFTVEDLTYMKKRDRDPLTMNIYRPITDGFISLITANNPRFKAIPSNDSGNKAGYIADFVLEYVWHESRAPRELERCALDYVNGGIGWMQAYIDPLADYGHGEIRVGYSPWFLTHWDWRAMMPGLRDKTWVLLFKSLPVGQLLAMAERFPEKEKAAAKAAVAQAKTQNWDRGFYTSMMNIASRQRSVGGFNSDGQYDRGVDAAKMTFLPGDFNIQAYDEMYNGTDDKHIPVLERYEIVYIEGHAYIDIETGLTKYLADIDFAKEDLLKSIRDVASPIKMPRVRRVMTLGGLALFHEEIMDCEGIPVCAAIRNNTNSAFPHPLGSLLRDPQDEQNKRHMAIIENALYSSAGRILYPENALDPEEYATFSRIPGGAIKYKPQMDASGQSAPLIPLQPVPLPNQFFYLDQASIPFAEYSFGVNSMMFGQTKNMPDTYRQTLQAEQYATRRMKAVELIHFEAMLEDLGQCVLEMAQAHYQLPKMLSIVDDEGVIRQLLLNEREADNPEKFLIDIRHLKYKVRIVPGSTMPTNKYALLELYMSLYDRGIMDQLSVLKKTEVTNPEEVIDRIGRLQQAMSTVDSMDKQIKQQEGIVQRLQTQLIQANIKMESNEMKLLMQMEFNNRKMSEELASAKVELGAKAFLEDLGREKIWLRREARMKTDFAVDTFKDRLDGVSERGGETGPSKKDREENG